MTPRCAARMITGSAAFSAAVAAPASPPAIASSTLRIEPRRVERRALLISVRRAIWRVALRADLVLAMSYSFDRTLKAETRNKRLDFEKKSGDETSRRHVARLIIGPCPGVNASERRRLRHPLGPNGIVTGGHRRPIGG